MHWGFRHGGGYLFPSPNLMMSALMARGGDDTVFASSATVEDFPFDPDPPRGGRRLHQERQFCRLVFLPQRVFDLIIVRHVGVDIGCVRGEVITMEALELGQFGTLYLVERADCGCLGLGRVSHRRDPPQAPRRGRGPAISTLRKEYYWRLAKVSRPAR